MERSNYHDTLGTFQKKRAPARYIKYACDEPNTSLIADISATGEVQVVVFDDRRQNADCAENYNNQFKCFVFRTRYSATCSLRARFIFSTCRRNSQAEDGSCKCSSLFIIGYWNMRCGTIIPEHLGRSSHWPGVAKSTMLQLQLTRKRESEAPTPHLSNELGRTSIFGYLGK